MIKLTLNFPTEEKEDNSKERILDAQKRKKASEETMEDAWERITSMKNSEVDAERLREVRQAMAEGIVGRNPNDNAKRFSKAEAMRLWSELQASQREQKLKDMVAKTPDNYYLITTIEQLKELVTALKGEPIIAVDTETNGLDYYGTADQEACSIVGISLTLPIANKHYYIPIAHDEKTEIDGGLLYSALGPFLTNENVKKVFHNAKFDINMFWRHGIEIKGLAHDTMIAMHLLNENEDSYALKNLATKYLKEPSDTYSTLFGKTLFSSIPLDIALVYAAKDTDITWKLYQFQMIHFNKLPKLKEVYETIENPLIDVVIRMERAGFVIDTDYAKTLGEDLKNQLSDLEKQLYQILGEINLNSPSQLKPAIENLVKHKIDSTDVDTLKKLQSTHEGIGLLLKYRELSKLLGTYVEALPQQIKNDGKIHGSFNQAATVTGRFSSNNPNLQNQPKFARKLFVAPKGKVLLAGDFSQQEPRLLAHFSQDPILIEAYKQGKDLYQSAASALFNKPESECGDGSKERKMMKFGILSVMYGTGSKTLAGQLGITQAEAEMFIENFYKTYPAVKKWLDGNVDFLRKHGYVEMLYGRKRRLAGYNSTDKWEKLRAERQASNAIIQGSAAIQTKLTMLALDELCKRKGWEMAFSIHDEVAVYAPEDVSIEDVKEFNEVMVSTVTLSVPNKSDIEISRRWGEGFSIKEWFKL